MLSALLTAILLRSLSSPELPSGWEAGIFAEDIDTGQVLLDVNSCVPMRPASTVKAVTTLSALRYLGAEYVYHTSILVDSSRATLILRGAGAPLLSAEDVTRTAMETAALLPEGSLWTLLTDPGAVTGESHLPGWDRSDWNRTYCPPVEPLCIGDNVLEVIVSSSDGHPRVQTYPRLPSLQLETERLSAGRTTAVTVNAGDWDREIPVMTVSGTIADGERKIIYKPFPGAPAELTGYLAEKLSETGLQVVIGGITENSFSSEDLPSASVMYSDPLWVILGSMNKWSRNMVAEQVLRTIAWKVTGDPGSTRAGCDISAAMLDSLVPGQTGWQLADGSGLSRLNLLTARQLAAVFSNGASSLEYGPEFLAGFPVNGVDGTLSTRMEQIPEGSFRGKTGSLNDTCTIAGILTTASGRRISVAIFLHIPEGRILRARSWQDRFIEDMYRNL
ncbi:D-alanyl-D-alanine carboxypeptidase/D-alanyl-D-alanine-endopeptidase [Candidatus Fermentibacteria bacterium]|nr:MAG: D-alanyl-D-alanine carboxypeptidase/D-alanyl-D-alanine-endopeptidase [Candidatus Fermentibacteria bacterium]